MRKGSCAICSVPKQGKCVSFSIQSLIESTAENYDKAPALLMSARQPCQFKSACCWVDFCTCCSLTDAQTTWAITVQKVFLSPAYLSTMSAMTQANICRPSGSCKATGDSGKEQSNILSLDWRQHQKFFNKILDSTAIHSPCCWFSADSK